MSTGGSAALPTMLPRFVGCSRRRTKTTRIEVSDEEIEEFLSRDPREVSDQIQRMLARQVIYAQKRAQLERKLPKIEVTEEEVDEYLRRDPRERDEENRRNLVRRILYYEKLAEQERTARDASAGE